MISIINSTCVDDYAIFILQSEMIATVTNPHTGINVGEKVKLYDQLAEEYVTYTVKSVVHNMATRTTTYHIKRS